MPRCKHVSPKAADAPNVFFVLVLGFGSQIPIRYIQMKICRSVRSSVTSA